MVKLVLQCVCKYERRDEKEEKDREEGRHYDKIAELGPLWGLGLET